MKKLKLITTTFALLLGWSSAWAQKDITSQYITNANLSNGTTGWTVSNFNVPVGGNGNNSGNGVDNIKYGWQNNATNSVNVTGAASESYAGWDNLNVSSYSMKQSVTLPKGSYRLVCYAFYREGEAYNTDVNTSRARLFAGTKAETNIATLGSITAGSYANSQQAGAICFDTKMYRKAIEFTVGEGGETFDIGVDGTFAVQRSWCILGKFELFDMNDLASVSSPTDMTYAITNPGFEYRSLEGWTNGSGETYALTNTEAFNDRAGIYWVEKWTSSDNGGKLGTQDDFKQTLSNMPAGLYELSVYAHNVEQGNGSAGGTGMYVMANSDQTEIGAAGQYKVRTTLASDGDLTVGIKLNNCSGNWIAFDRFELKFFGDPLKAYQDLMDEAIETAEGIDQSKLPTAIKSELAGVISTYKGQSYSTEDEYNTATTNINNAIDKANASIPLFADFNTLKGQADALVAVENTNAEANSTLSTAISTQNTAVVEATTADAISTAISTLKTAMITYAGAADPTSGNRFDLTFMMTNPSLDAFAAWTKNIPGWDSEETDGNYQAMVNDSKTVGDKDHFYEYWSNPAKASGKFALYNAVTLPAGTYSMSCYAFAENQYAAETVNGVFFYANDTQGSAVTSTALSEQSISFINESEQEVKIGLKTQTGNTRNWMGIGYVKLYKEYTDNNTYTITTIINDGDVAVTVDDEPATSAKALKTVTLTVSNYTEGYAVGNVTATYNDGEVKNLDVANPSENVYTYQQPAYNVTVTINVVVDKRTLNTAIAEATAARKSANEGTGVFQIPAAAGSALAGAISTAQGVYDNAEATVSQVADAVTAINTAKTTYEGATFNAPDASKRYVLTIVEDGKDWNGNAVTFIEGARTDMGGYGIKYLAPANANLNQALKFTAVDGETNTYKVSAINVADGGERYITTGSTYDGGNNAQIRTTDDASKASWIKIQATSTDGQFKLLNVSDGNNVIANNNNNDMYTANTCNFTIAEAAQASVNVTIAADVKFATRIFPFTPALPAGIKAYNIESAADGVITLAEVADPAANTPYILYAEEGYNGDALTGFGTAGATTYTANNMTGVYEATTSQEGWYVLQNNGGKVGFYQVGAEVKPTIAAYRCYFTGPSSARAFIFDMETTAINAINALTTGETEIYDLNGVKQNRLQKGINIVNKNGKTFKVMVK